jgi:hypothetical protein
MRPLVIDLCHKGGWSMNKPKLTPLERKILLAAIADGGAVELSGLDAHPGANGHWVNAAARLHRKGMGCFVSTNSIFSGAFRISVEGRVALEG